MGPDFPVLLVDDGELDDVRDLLSSLDVDFAHLRGAAVPERLKPPQLLFVTTSRRALLAREWPVGRRVAGPTKIAVVDEDSQTLRNMLRRLGYDYLVRRPVHPVALRLLLTRAIFRGSAQRREERVTIGYPVTVRSRFRRRNALLAELSMEGCRLLCERPLDAGASVSVQLPGELTGGRGITLKGRVERAEAEDVAAGLATGTSVAVAFAALHDATRAKLRAVLRDRAEGPATLSSPADVGKDAETAETSGGAADRRQHPRKRFDREVVALAGDAKRVLLGRDLSAGGMRIDPHPELPLGASVQVAIYGSAREEPFLVNAEVVRDDGERGLGLRFQGVDPALAARLERTVAGLPAVEALGDGEAGSVGTVMTELRPPARASQAGG